MSSTGSWSDNFNTLGIKTSSPRVRSLSWSLFGRHTVGIIWSYYKRFPREQQSLLGRIRDDPTIGSRRCHRILRPHQDGLLSRSSRVRSARTQVLLSLAADRSPVHYLTLHRLRNLAITAASPSTFADRPLLLVSLLLQLASMPYACSRNEVFF